MVVSDCVAVEVVEDVIRADPVLEIVPDLVLDGVFGCDPDFDGVPDPVLEGVPV